MIIIRFRTKEYLTLQYKEKVSGLTDPLYMTLSFVNTAVVNCKQQCAKYKPGL